METVTVESIPITLGRQDDGRWWADVESMPGVVAYGDSRESAIAAVHALALRVAADCIEHGEDVPKTLAGCSPSHEPLAVCKGTATLGHVAPDWNFAWQNGSHRRLVRPGWANYTFAFHDNDEVGPGLLGQIAKKTCLTPDDL
ncbi:MAG: hypothetical protein ABSH50_20280 [Bryobacteraceae bacterium]|jgi:predicted RNase H-like HicB family nuclease/predicted RNA binding protein YcfA (HicA-like mRNA interferase family)